MKQLLNTLYVTTQGAYLRLENGTVKVEVEKEVKLTVPLHHLVPEPDGGEDFREYPAPEGPVP